MTVRMCCYRMNYGDGDGRWEMGDGRWEIGRWKFHVFG